LGHKNLKRERPEHGPHNAFTPEKQSNSPSNDHAAASVLHVLLATNIELCYLLRVPIQPNAPQNFDADEWAQKLAHDVKAVLDRFPDADPDNVRHALILLQKSPEERLARSLLRGGARAKRR
jgi:hypothetical protein